jgi:O-antigen biosynthesis protein
MARGSMNPSAFATIPRIADLRSRRKIFFIEECSYSDRAGPLNQNPTFSIVIPNKNSAILIFRCLRQIYRTTQRSATEVVVVDNKSSGWLVRKIYKHFIDRHGLRVVDGCSEFNFSRLVNIGVAHSLGKYVILYNNDVLAMEANWLDALAELLTLGSASVVGAVLYYPNETVQHAGIAEIANGRYEHIERYTKKVEFQNALPKNVLGYSCIAVTGAVMMIPRKIWDSLAGFDPRFPENNGDVDFCLRAVKFGGVFVSVRTHLVHLESISRGYGR